MKPTDVFISVGSNIVPEKNRRAKNLIPNKVKNLFLSLSIAN